jgi:hypothetical protein
MKFSASRCVLLLVSSAMAASAAEKPTAKEEIKALVLEDARKAAQSPSAPAAKSAQEKEKKTAPAKKNPDVPTPTASVTATTPATDPTKPAEPAVQLPQVEVNKRRVTQLEHDLQEQDRKIAFEAKNAKATEADNALNSPGLSPGILGGYSSKVRTGLAQERLELMEFEKDLREAIARAKTKKEKDELQKQLEDIRAMRRSLDSTPEPKGR